MSAENVVGGVLAGLGQFSNNEVNSQVFPNTLKTALDNMQQRFDR